jgi:hypothetical protein
VSIAAVFFHFVGSGNKIWTGPTPSKHSAAWGSFPALSVDEETLDLVPERELQFELWDLSLADADETASDIEKLPRVFFWIIWIYSTCFRARMGVRLSWRFLLCLLQ